MTKNEIYSDIYRAYDKDRSEAEIAAQHRKKAMFQKFPRLGEIQRELDKSGIALAEIFVKGGDKNKNLAQFRENCRRLEAEKAEILKTNGYSVSYFEPEYKCSKCKDTGYTDKKRCECFRKRLIEKYYDMSNISKIIAEENFDNFNLDLYSDEYSENGKSAKQNIKEIVIDVISKLENINEHPVNILFTGHSGLGKTYMCNCIAKSVIDKGLSVIYMSAYSLFDKMIKQRFNINSNDESYALLKDCDLLVIDDLGTEGVNANTITEFFNIINTRYLDKKSTVISTNLSLTEINNVYSERIISRIMGNYKCYIFFGKDLRIFK